MRIIAHAPGDAGIALVPSASGRESLEATAALREEPTIHAASACGWDLLCPYAFEATWNGGPAPEDVTISAPGFAVSVVGDGVISLALGYTFEIADGHQLWLRGPINEAKDGLAPVERLVDAELLPLVAAIHWRFTRPGQTVRFTAGEPFCTILPYPSGYVEQFIGEIRAAQAQPPPAEPAPAPATRQVDESLPGVSCICVTYARAALLEEAIQSFLNQDYAGPKELIILNDFDRQTLVFESPEVRIVNLPHRFHTLGEKVNAATALATYDLICPWDDDDIYLPHRLTRSAAGLAQHKGFFKPSSAFFWNNGAISSIERNVFHAACCYTRAMFDKAGGYPHINSGYDIALEQTFEHHVLDATTPAELPPEELFYFYRWAGTGSYHISGVQKAADDGGQGYAQVAAFAAAKADAGEIPIGLVHLRPHWHCDYVAQAQAFLTNRPPVPPPTAPTEPAAPPIVFTYLPQPTLPEVEAALLRGTAPLAISVIVPAANESFYLQRTVEQFQATLPPRSEVIVVDNGSIDGCADFLAGPRVSHPRDEQVAVRLIRTPERLGVSRARNLGLARSYGEVLVVADAHVDLPPGWWQPMVATLNRPGVGLVGPGFGVLGNDQLNPACGQRIASTGLRTEWLPYRGRDPYPVPVLGGGFMALRRETLECVGPFDDGMVQWGAEDLEICLRMWLMGYEVWLTPDVAIPHYFRTTNPNKVEYYWVIHNTLRTAILHFGAERLARVLWSFNGNKLYPKAMALCVQSDVWQRRDALVRSRRHDDDWFFAHPYFQAIDMAV
jgi:glycosyltransferase involved in cell wall biosynthesis